VGEVEAFIEAVGGQATPGEFAELIYRETEGNPFFVAEILRHLVDTGAIRHEGDAWVGTPESVVENLPEGVREVIGRRLDGLSEGCNAALAVAAAMPGGFTVDIVGEVAGIDEDTMLDVLDEALGAQVVRERRERPGTYEFNHALIRQTLYGELSTPRRVRMHRRVGEALERSFADSIEAHLPELAYHAYEAAPGGDVDKAVEFSRRAGDRAMGQVAYEEAARSYGMAIQALDLVADAAPAARADLLLALAGASDRGGDAETCRAASLEVAALARSISDPERLALAAIGYAGSYWVSGSSEPDAQRMELFEQSEKALQATPAGPTRDALLSKVLARHAGAVAFRDQGTFRLLVEGAMEAARRSSDPAALSSALQVYLMQNLSSDERDGVLREVVDAAASSGDLELMQSSRQSLIISAVFEQQRDDWDLQVEAYRAEAERSRVSVHVVTSLQLRGALAAADGRYEDAERDIVESAEVARSLGVPDVLANVGVALAPVYRELGRLAGFEEPTRRMVAETPDIPAWKAGLAQTLYEIGKVDEAASLVDEVVEQGYEAVSDDVLRRYTVAMLAEVAAATGDAASLSYLDDWLQADDLGEGRGVLLAGLAYHGAFDRYLGLVACALGRHDEAIGKHETALAQHEQMRARGWAARSRYDLARAHLARGAEGDAARASALVSEVVEQASELGMSRLVEQALAVKLELQGVPSGAPVTASIDIVSASIAIERPDLGAHADGEGHVTICFSDIVGYTEMTDRLGDHRTHELLRSHTAILRKELIANRGVEVKSEGDGFMLAFRDPTAALAFAKEFQRGLEGHVWPDEIGALRVRIGVHRGGGDPGGGRLLRPHGDHRRARVAATAGAGEVLVTDEVREVAGDGFSFGEVRQLSLKGLSRVHPAAPLLWSR
jgi:class 3 adenylate cyclase/tetratricopeptide (TPR) repeat protein